MKRPKEDDHACPLFHVGPCCADRSCKRFIVAIFNPVMKEVDGTLVPAAYFPVEHSQELVDKIRELAKAKGVKVR